jgi:hypothetical protein
MSNVPDPYVPESPSSATPTPWKAIVGMFVVFAILVMLLLASVGGILYGLNSMLVTSAPPQPLPPPVPTLPVPMPMAQPPFVLPPTPDVAPPAPEVTPSAPEVAPPATNVSPPATKVARSRTRKRKIPDLREAIRLAEVGSDEDRERVAAWMSLYVPSKADNVDDLHKLLTVMRSRNQFNSAGRDLLRPSLATSWQASIDDLRINAAAAKRGQ